MSFPRYPKYKDSGIEWLGEVPDHWHIKGMRNIANIVRGASPRPAGDPKYFGGESVPWVTVAEITKDDHVELRETESYLTDEGAKQSKRFAPGTLIYSNSGATLGVPKILSIDACANDGVVAFEGMSPDVSPRFLYHFLASITAAIREKVKQGSGQPNLNTDIVKDLQFALPPPIEQQAIESFLDLETSKIDSLVGEQRRLIELLKEKRQAVISHAVTKGLNPNAPLKPSGIEWLGDVPEHWEVRKLKFLCDIQTGDKDTENAVEDGLYPFFVRSQTVERINSMSYDCEAILTAGDGVGVGKVFHYHNGSFDFHQRVYMMNEFRNVSGPYLFHYFREHFYKVALEGGAKSTVDSLRRPMLTNFPVCVPPSSEQGDIVATVEIEAAKFDALTAEAERGIELLQERRTALISAAVTGKIDVRGLLETERS